ncbi:MAG: ribosome biogenesis GTP-binding protein YihA/YsxC [Thermodesulfobacteriota bacterium]
MLIKSACFVAAAPKLSAMPPESSPEVAFAGRSNVGKSSLLNCLLSRKKLVRTGSKPGVTRQLNFFSVNDNLLLVDLPGYGYARVSKSERREWKPLVEGYLVKRQTLRGVVVIVDVRRGPEKEEAELLAFLAEKGIPSVLVATKADKLSRGKAASEVRKIGAAAGQRAVLFSAETGQGREDLWKVIEGFLEEPEKGGEKEATQGAEVQDE